MIFSLKFGGYYSYRHKDNHEYQITRILNITPWAIHKAMFDQTFPLQPEQMDFTLTPFILHVPIDIADILNWNEIKFIGHAPLTLNDLDGYAYYLDEHSQSDEDKATDQQLLDDIIQLSQNSNFTLKLSINKNEDGTVRVEKVD